MSNPIMSLTLAPALSRCNKRHVIETLGSVCSCLSEHSPFTVHGCHHANRPRIDEEKEIKAQDVRKDGVGVQNTVRETIKRVNLISAAQQIHL